MTTIAELPLDIPAGNRGASYIKQRLEQDTAKKARGRRNERFEKKLAFDIRAHQLPVPLLQYRWATELRSKTGKPRQFRADFAWPSYRLLLEVQGGIWRRGGGAHSHPQNIERDVDKAQCAVLLGWHLLPVTTDEVKRGDAIELLERVFASRGWTR